MVNIITLDGKRYMVDVGFGANGATEPLPLEDGLEVAGISPVIMRLVHQNIPNNTNDHQHLWIYQRKDIASQGWKHVICFGELEFLPRDYEIMNFWTSQNRLSIFTYTIMVAKMIMEPGRGLIGVLTVLNGDVKRRIGTEVEVLKICRTEPDRISALGEYFDLHLSGSEQAGIRGLCTKLRGQGG